MVRQTPLLSFLRSMLLITAILIPLSVWGLVALAGELEVILLASKSWMGLLLLLAFIGLSIWLALGVSYMPTVKRNLLSLVDENFSVRFSGKSYAFIGLILFIVGLLSYSATSFLPAFKLLNQVLWVRILGFWIFTLLGTFGFKLFQMKQPWTTAFIVTILSQSTIHRFLSDLTVATSYPFSLGWAETTRFYLASLFVSKQVYGQALNWPIINPSLHILLIPPYLMDAPLWFHRFWQMMLRYVLLGITAFVFARRVSLPGRLVRFLIALWVFLFLFQGPLYFHLSLIVIVIMYGVSFDHPKRIWFLIVISSIWAGVSRINWFPVPASLVSMLYLLETPYSRGKFWQYVWRPVAWIVIGMGTAFISQRIYIVASSTDVSAYYTSLVSNLLWYRLWPNITFSLGIIPGILLVSMPLVLLLGYVYRNQPIDLHPLRTSLIILGIFTFFVTGAIVSTKIGGGADLHNMDVYLVLFLLVTMYVVFGRYTPQSKPQPASVSLPWSLALIALLVPVWFAAQTKVGFRTYDTLHTQRVIQDLQGYVDDANRNGQDVLFISQRQLIAFQELENVPITPEYEREELMEMAMSNQEDYLKAFRSDMENQRFAFIIVDPLKYRLLGPKYFMGEENNVWVRRVMKHILCNYQEAAAFPADQIAIYVPQIGKRQCP